MVTLQLLVLPWFLRSKFLYWNKASYKRVSLVYIVYLLKSFGLPKMSHTSEPDKNFNFFFFDPWGFKGSMLIACVYKDLHDLLLTDQALRIETDNHRCRYFHITPCRLPPKIHITETHKI